MSSRRAIVEVLERLSFSAELLGDRRARTYGAASWTIRNLEGDPAELRQSGELEKIRGIGKSVLAVVDAVLAHEKPEALVKMEARVPEGLFAIRRIKGLGPKKIKPLWKELGITTLGELEYACRENRLVDLTGFGFKTQAKVLDQIEEIRRTEGLLRRDQARALLELMIEELRKNPSVIQAESVGEYRRGLELVRQPGLLIETTDEAVAQQLVNHFWPPEVPIDIHFAHPDAFGAQMVWWSSAPEHRNALATRAKTQGLVFDEAGLHGVACSNEDALYQALQLVPTPAELREAHVPLVVEGKARPRPVRRQDLRGALHNHTSESDGAATLLQMQTAAHARGLTYLGISEHSQAASYARGLEPARLVAQIQAIQALNAKDPVCVLLTGIESDILQDGGLDYEDRLLRQLEVVVASVHRRHAQDANAMTKRMVAAASHPLTDVVGHPTGRLLLGRPPSDYDVAAFLEACAQNGTAVELNANPHRLDLNETHLAMAKERGLLISISADAHATGELDNLDYGITIARRAGLTAEDVLNTKSLSELRTWLTTRRNRNPVGT